MKKINYVYYIILVIILYVILKFEDQIEEIIGIKGYIFLLCFYTSIYMLFSQGVIYAVVRKKGVKDDFCTTYQCKFEWSTFWVDTMHNELACLCMFNPFKIQYVSLNRVHDADIKIRYSSGERHIAYLNIRFYIDGRKQKFRINTSSRYGWDNTKENVEILTEDARKLAEVINNKPIQM